MGLAVAHGEPRLTGPPERRTRRRLQRRLAGALAVVSGVLDLIVAASWHARHGAHESFLSGLLGTLGGARYPLLLAGLALIWCHRGLRRGTRNAWFVALAGGALSILAGHRHTTEGMLGVAAGGVLLVTLGVLARSFGAHAEASRVRDGIRLLIVGEAVVLAYGTVGLYRLDDHFQDATTLAQSVREAFRLLLLLPTSTIEPVTRHGHWFVDSVRFGTLVVALTSVTWLVDIVAFGRRRHDEAVVHALLEEWSTGALDHFLTFDDKSWHVAADGQAFVGYTVTGRTAIALGDPVGRPESRQEALDEFVEVCERNGWSPAIHQLSPAGAAMARRSGLRTVKIGEEAIVDVRGWSIDAPGHKALRSAQRRVARAGLEVVELPQPLSDADLAELKRVSDRWMQVGAHRERRFTLGRFDPAYLRSTAVLAVRHRGTGRIAAFANVLPAYHAENGNFDLMRRDPEAPNGVMEALMIGLIERFRDEGRAGMTLGLAPLTNITGSGVAERAMRLAYERGERMFNYQGLRQFKDKWDPRWEPRYLAYAGERDLPRTALDVARAGELPSELPLWHRLSTMARDYPVTIAIGVLALWFMVATAVDRRTHATLLRHLGLAWRDLLHLQFWRLATSQLVQSEIGLGWATLLGVVVALALAERRFGSRIAVVLFFLSDWISTLAVLLACRGLAHFGVAAAIHHLRVRDSGSSSGMWATIAALAASTGRPRRRLAAAGAVVAVLVAVLLVHQRVVDVQHLLAALAGLALAMIVAARGGELPWRPCHHPTSGDRRRSSTG